MTDLARQITANARTPYAQALALQNYLRTHFSYSLAVPKGHSDSALVDFLFDTKAGFCEQFSSAFAAMARSIGLPTRRRRLHHRGTPDAAGRVPRHHAGRARVARGRLRRARLDPVRADAHPLRPDARQLHAHGWRPRSPTTPKTTATTDHHHGDERPARR